MLNIYQPTEQELKKAETIRTIKESILQQLHETKDGCLHPFAFKLDEFEPEDIKEAGKELADEELVRIDENLFICLYKE